MSRQVRKPRIQAKTLDFPFIKCYYLHGTEVDQTDIEIGVDSKKPFIEEKISLLHDTAASVSVMNTAWRYYGYRRPNWGIIMTADSHVVFPCRTYLVSTPVIGGLF